MADFNFKSQIDPTAIAGLAQRQAQTQAEMDQQASQQKMKMIQEVAQSVGSLVSSSIEASKKRQNEDFLKKYAASQVPNQMMPQQGPGMPAQAGPIYGAEQTLPSVSTPDYAGQNAAKAAVAMNPAQFAKDLSATFTQTPLQKAEAEKNHYQSIKDRQLTGPTTAPTQALVNRAAGILKITAPDMAGMSEQQSNQWLDNAKGQLPQLSASNPGELTDDDRRRLKPLARMIGEYRVKDPSTLVSARGAEKEKLSMVLAEDYPNVNLQNYATQSKLRNDYTPSGTSGKSLTALNTVIGHLDTLQSKLESLDNAEVTKYNTVGNWAAKNVGKPEVSGFNAAKTLVDGELGKIVQGSGVVTNEERRQFKEDLDSASSPAQAKEVIATWMDLMKSRTDAIKANWTQTMGDTKAPVPFINDKAKKILIKRGYNPDTLEKMDPSAAAGGKFVALDGGYSYRVK